METIEELLDVNRDQMEFKVENHTSNEIQKEIEHILLHIDPEKDMKDIKSVDVNATLSS